MITHLNPFFLTTVTLSRIGKNSEKLALKMLLSFFIKRKRALLYQYLAALQPYIDGVRRVATSHLSRPA